MAVPSHKIEAIATPGTSSSGRTASGYHVSEADKQLFAERGYVHLPGVMSEEDMQSEIDEVYEMFMRGEIRVEGADLCDMSGAKGRTPDEFTVYNVMLPRTYYPAWQGNLYEKRCQDIANQLQGGDMVADYDQVLAKMPKSQDAIFAWHQDMAYWPPFTAEKATATCWLAVSDASVENGCMRFIPGTHKEKDTRPHYPVSGSRRESHALFTEVLPGDQVVNVPIRRGDITVHNESVMHGSGPNLSDTWRKAYVLAFRKAACVAEERSHGFTHSHNDTFNWDSWTKRDS
jgi:phytanoyl-CoA hydroxylase